jgi:hypothetical protein
VGKDAVVHVDSNDPSRRADEPGDIYGRLSASAAEIEHIQAGRNACAIEDGQCSRPHGTRQHAEPLGPRVAATDNVVQFVPHVSFLQSETRFLRVTFVCGLQTGHCTRIPEYRLSLWFAEMGYGEPPPRPGFRFAASHGFGDKGSTFHSKR